MSDYDDFKLIHVYTRAQAIKDGVLFDVSKMAREAGFLWPVAITAAVQSLIEAIPPRLQGINDLDGRLWDVLWMAHMAIRKASHNDDELLYYGLILPHGRKKNVTLKLVTGPGDHGEPVVTIMLPDED